MADSRFTPNRDRLQIILDAIRVPHEALPGGVFARAFDGWFRVAEAARPGLAATFLAGIILAIRRRRPGIVAAGCMALANVLGAAWMMTPLDRFSVPLLPIMLVVAGSALVAGPPRPEVARLA